MLVPAHWAEGVAQQRGPGPQVTVRRQGWSDVSQLDAQVLADRRAQDALGRLLAGDVLPKREARRGYDGADGVPIREEIVERAGRSIITRNSYGARCLNTADVLFADIDFDESGTGGAGALGVGLLWWLLTLVVAGGAGAVMGSWAAVSLGGVGAVWGLVQARRRRHALRAEPAARADTPATRARARIDAFASAHPDWHLRVYRTPAGYRVLVMQQTFDPVDPQVAAFFDALAVDPVYARMCRQQRCFRARLSAKPWRMGSADPGRFSRAVWPVAGDPLARRRAWVGRYESAASHFRACRLEAEIGSSVVHPDALAVMAVHDDRCRVREDLPMA